MMDITAQRRIVSSYQGSRRQQAACRRRAAGVTAPQYAKRRDQVSDWAGQRLIGLGWRLARPDRHLGVAGLRPADAG